MAPQQARMTMDLVKLASLFAMAVAIGVWSGKHTEKLDHLESTVNEMRSDIKTISQEMHARAITHNP